MFSRWDYWQYRRWRRRRCRRIIFFLTVALVIVAAATAHATGTHARHANTVSPGRHSSPAAHRSRVKAARTARPERPRIGTAGTDLRWVDFHGIQLPVSAQDGPRHARRGQLDAMKIHPAQISPGGSDPGPLRSRGASRLD